MARITVNGVVLAYDEMRTIARLLGRERRGLRARLGVIDRILGLLDGHHLDAATTT